MKTVLKILKILVILALVAVIPVIIFVKPSKAPFGDGIVFEQNEMPLYADSLSDVDPYDLPKTDEGKIALAAKLYAVANQNVQKLDKCAFLISYNSNIDIDVILMKFSIPILGYRYQLKTGMEYYATEYALPLEGGEQLADWFAKDSSMFASRSYTDVSKMNYMYSEKCYEPKFIDDPETGLRIESDFSAENRVPKKLWATEQKNPVFCSAQDKPYYAANRPMTETNILSADVEFVKSKDGNFYRVTIELDTEKEETYANTIDELRAGAGEDARYVNMVETLEIWENGYYKSFRSVDQCSAKKGLMNFVFDFHTYFFYDDAHCTPDAYDNFATVKELALAYDAAK